MRVLAGISLFILARYSCPRCMHHSVSDFRLDSRGRRDDFIDLFFCSAIGDYVSPQKICVINTMKNRGKQCDFRCRERNGDFFFHDGVHMLQKVVVFESQLMNRSEFS